MTKTAHFLGTSHLDVRLCDDGLWMHLRPLVFRSLALNRIVIAEMGSKTDFCSVPRFPLIYAKYGNRAHKAGAMHDAALAQGMDRTHAAALFLEVLHVEGIPEEDCEAMWLAVRINDQKYSPPPDSPLPQGD